MIDTHCDWVVEGVERCYRAWSVLMRLLQDEDEQVRRLASKSVQLLTELDSSESPANGKYTPLHVVFVTCVG